MVRAPSDARPSRSAALALVALVASVAVAGCFGYEGVRPNDVVTMRITIEDAEGNMIVQDLSAGPFRVGTGNSGLGAQFEERIVGLQENESFRIPLDLETQRVDAVLGRDPADTTVQASQITSQLGIPPEDIVEGYVIEAPAGNFEIVAVEGSSVTVRPILRDDVDGREVEPYPALGIELHVYFEGDMIVREMVPMEGAVVSLPVLEQDQFINPFGVAPGAYRMAGTDGDQIVLEPVGASVVSGTILSVEAAGGAPAEGDHFGSRSSPVRIN